MSRKTVIDKEIMKDVIREYQDGTGPAELSRIYKIPRSTLYYWLSKVTVSGSTQKDRMSQLKTENTRLKLILAENVLSLIMMKANATDDKALRQKLDAILAINEAADY